MASPVQSPSLRQLQLITPSETPFSPPSSSTSSPSATYSRSKQQRRQSSISYTSSGLYPNGIRSYKHDASNRRSSIDFSHPTPVSPPLQTHKRRARPLSIAIPNHNPTAASISAVQGEPRPQTLTEIYAPFLALIANKEAQVSDLRSQLSAQEKELSILKRKWEKIVRNHLAFPDREKDGLTGLDGLDKIIRGLQNAATTAADAVSEASSGQPSPIFSRLSFDSSTPSASTDMNHTSPDSSVDLPITSKPVLKPTSPPQTVTTTVSRRRSLVSTEKRSTTSSPADTTAPPVPSTSLPSSSNPKRNLRQRDNVQAPLPGTALSSAAFSLLPQLSNMSSNLKNVNFSVSDFRGGMDKFISPQQQKRASKVFEGLWDAVASPSAARNDRKEKEKSDTVNLLESESEEDTVMPSTNSQFAVMAPDKSPHLLAKKQLDLSITASPSLYLTKRNQPPPIKEEDKESDDSEDWNW